MHYIVSGLPVEPYQHLYGLSDQQLAEFGVKRYVADEAPGYPDRIEMRDANIGENLLLLNHTSVPENTPYRATHAIFILEGATQTYRGENQIPEVMSSRQISLRGFDQNGMMTDAEIARGEDIERAIHRLFDNPKTTHINAHNAVRGCYSGRIERA